MREVTNGRAVSETQDLFPRFSHEKERAIILRAGQMKLLEPLVKVELQNQLRPGGSQMLKLEWSTEAVEAFALLALHHPHPLCN